MELALADIIPISQARARLTELADDVATHGGAKLLTRNGEGYAAIVPAQDLEDLQRFRAAQRLADLQAFARGLQDVQAGRTVSAEAFKAEMAELVQQVCTAFVAKQFPDRPTERSQ